MTRPALGTPCGSRPPRCSALDDFDSADLSERQRQRQHEERHALQAQAWEQQPPGGALAIQSGRQVYRTGAMWQLAGASLFVLDLSQRRTGPYNPFFFSFFMGPGGSRLIEQLRQQLQPPPAASAPTANATEPLTEQQQEQPDGWADVGGFQSENTVALFYYFIIFTIIIQFNSIEENTILQYYIQY
jgi:hypothetical protein